MNTLIIGLDAFDPFIFESLSNSGKLPGLSRLMKLGGYSKFEVSNPPQSEVSWTSIATGLNPGEHGMFDFVHRDPAAYALQVSLLPMKRGIGGLEFARPYQTHTLFDTAAERGYQATALWWPATFPARADSPVRTIPGLGTPDIQGRLGVGAFYSSNPDMPEKMGKTPVFKLNRLGMDRFQAHLEGPQIGEKPGASHATLPFELRKISGEMVDIQLGQNVHRLALGEWSLIIEIRFKVSWLVSVYAITRLVVTSLEPEVQIYFLPLQIHPLHPIWRYATPNSFVKDAWNTCGPFLTLGWPQDTTGLEDGCITDELFLSLCDSIFEARSRLLFHLLDRFKEGVLASVFDSLDRIQHMFLLRRPDVVEKWYIRYDQLVNRVLDHPVMQKDKPPRLLVVSDHGFNRFDYKVHLNRWLIDKGYLVAQPGNGAPEWKSIDWAHTRAYAIGLNSLYLNLAEREKDGVIAPEDRASALETLQLELQAWQNSQGAPIVRNARLNEHVFEGALVEHAPDLLVGYSPGYRASAETGLGGWADEPLAPNRDHWEADHCFDSSAVPGVIFSSHGLNQFPNPSYRDFTALAIDAAPVRSSHRPPSKLEAEDQEKVEERLKSLGYL